MSKTQHIYLVGVCNSVCIGGYNLNVIVAHDRAEAKIIALRTETVDAKVGRLEHLGRYDGSPRPNGMVCCDAAYR